MEAGDHVTPRTRRAFTDASGPDDSRPNVGAEPGGESDARVNRVGMARYGVYPAFNSDPRGYGPRLLRMYGRHVTHQGCDGYHDDPRRAPATCHRCCVSLNAPLRARASAAV